MRTRILLLAAAAATLARPAHAQAPARGRLPEWIQEFFLAETVYPQERGEVQLTAFSRLDDGPHTRFLAEYGITDRLQVGAVSPALESGAGEEEKAASLSVLYALLPNAEPLAVSAEVEVAMSDEEAPRWEPALIAARRIGPVQVHGTVASELAREAAPGWSAAVGVMVDARRLTPTFEVAWEDEETFVAPGLFVHPRKGVELGVGAPVCTNCEHTPVHVRVMLTVEF